MLLRAQCCWFMLFMLFMLLIQITLVAAGVLIAAPVVSIVVKLFFRCKITAFFRPPKGQNFDLV